MRRTYSHETKLWHYLSISPNCLSEAQRHQNALTKILKMAQTLQESANLMHLLARVNLVIP